MTRLLYVLMIIAFGILTIHTLAPELTGQVFHLISPSDGGLFNNVIQLPL